jgi:hypothetical protein
MQLDLLQQNYKTNEAVRAICDHISDRSNNQNETGLDRIHSRLGQDGYDFKRSDVIAAFRLLEIAECGKYIEGRHGKKSRFLWLVESKLVAGAAQGTETKAALVAEDASNDESIKSEMIEHSYFLRPNLELSIELPANLSRNEAQRLSQFIDSLSFEG